MKMTLQKLTFILMSLAMAFTAIIAFNTIRNSLDLARIRRQRQYIYAQLDEKIAEWDGLAPRPVEKYEVENLGGGGEIPHSAVLTPHSANQPSALPRQTPLQNDDSRLQNAPRPPDGQ